ITTKLERGLLMDNIISEIVEIINNNPSLMDIEMAVETYFTEVLSQVFSRALERRSSDLILEYKEKGFEIDRIEERTVQFSFGPVVLKRRRMRKKGEKNIVPLDIAIGLEKHKRYSPLVEMKVVSLASDSVYRKASDAIELLTPLSISHGAIHSMTQRLGETIQNYTDEAPLHDETHKKYPFNFKLIIKYTLEEDCLTVTYKVKNRSLKDDMYYGIGGHPAFNVSQTTNEAGNEEFNQVYFRFEPNHEQLYIPLSKEGLLKLKEAKTQKVNEIQLTHETFKEDALIYKIKPNSVMILTDKANQVEIRLNPQEMNHVGIWSPYPKRAGFVCLEPWAGVADDEETFGQMDEKYGINKLNPEQIMDHHYTIQFIKK